jgi:flagellar motor switch/type III secretory pathway protein FliN
MSESASAAQSQTDTAETSAAWTRVQGLSCELTVDLPLPGMKVRDLMQLGKDLVIDSRWQVSSDVPMRVNGGLIAWGEFEVVGDRLAVRMTELA